MSGVTEVSKLGASLLEGTTPTLRPSAHVRARPSVADVADRTVEASERALADYADLVARLKAENAALRGEVAQLHAQSAEAAAASEAAMQAQEATIESQAGAISDLRGELADLTRECDKAKSRLANLSGLFMDLHPLGPKYGAYYGGAAQKAVKMIADFQ